MSQWYQDITFPLLVLVPVTLRFSIKVAIHAQFGTFEVQLPSYPPKIKHLCLYLDQS